MDPATAFQVSCGIVQLVQIGISTVKTFRDIYNSKSKQGSDYERLQSEVEALQNAAAGLGAHFNEQQANVQLADDQKRLQNVCGKSREVAQALIDRLSLLTPDRPLRRRDVPKQWYKLQRESGEIDRLRAQLLSLYEVLNTQILVRVSRQARISGTLPNLPMILGSTLETKPGVWRRHPVLPSICGGPRF